MTVCLLRVLAFLEAVMEDFLTEEAVLLLVVLLLAAFFAVFWLAFWVFLVVAVLFFLSAFLVI
ncbi:hypothetical protein ACLB1R_08555 [Escherichia coli]